jgi:predicted permease
MTDLIRDVVIAARRLRKAPAFTLFSIVTLALGIGATTAIYSAIHAAILRPPDIPDVDRVVNLYHSNPINTPGTALRGFSWPDFESLQSTQSSFSQLVAWSLFDAPMIANGTGSVLTGEAVGSDYFSLVGVEATLGRTIQPADDRVGAPPVLVLSHSAWQRDFGGAADIVGRWVELKGHQFQIIGVVPARFRGVHLPSIGPTRSWIPLHALPLLRDYDLTNRSDSRLFVKARLKATVTVQAAEVAVRVIARQLDQAFPLEFSPRVPIALRGRQWSLTPAAAVYVHETVHHMAGPLALVVAGMVMLVLLVTCTNLANLLLARGATSRQQIAIRSAMGASRWRLIREQLVESALVASAGVILALLVARVLVGSVLSSSLRLGPGFVMEFQPVINIETGVAALIASGLAFVIFGVLPALHLTRTEPRAILAVESNGVVPRWRGRRNLIAVQVAASVTLAAIAALFSQQIAALARHESGMDLERLAVVRLRLTQSGYTEERSRPAVEAILDAVRREPRIVQAAASSRLPFASGPDVVIAHPGTLAMNGRLQGVNTTLLSVTPEFAQTVGLPIRRGRGVEAGDLAKAQQVVVVSEAVARTLFGMANPVGRELLVQDPRRHSTTSQAEITPRTIVGVTRDVVPFGERRGTGMILVPLAQHFPPDLMVIARTDIDPAGMVGALLAATQSVDRALITSEAGTALALVGPTTLPLRVAAWLSGLLGVLAIALAMAGLYGVLSHLVATRTAEIGIRMALGAGTSRLRRMILWDGVRPIVEGLLIAVPFVAILWTMLSRAMFSRMFLQRPANDPVFFIAVPLLFITVGFIACYLPARRASSVDPNVALRQL